MKQDPGTAIRAITTVYSYYLPEVRAVVDRLVATYPHDVFLSSITPGLDNYHVPVIERLISAYQEDVPALASFGHRYPTAGSEEGIREILSLLAARGVRQIYMFRGDYEGYREVARSRGIETVEAEIDAAPTSLTPGWWFLSNPSARDGNVLPEGTVERVCAAGHRVFYDLSYVKSTRPARFSLSHPNVFAAAVSFSKPFGLFYYRVGFTFCREAVPALAANKWFKNMFGLLLADRMLGELDFAAVCRRYKAAQAEIVEAVNREHALGLRASDAFLLANLDEQGASSLSPELRDLIVKYRRGDGYRFCLTPYFLAREGR